MKRERQPFSEVVRQSCLLLRAYQSKNPKVNEELKIFYCGRWRPIGKPYEWFGSEFWAAATYQERLSVIQCELLKRLRKFYIFTDVPDCFKL